MQTSRGQVSGVFASGMLVTSLLPICFAQQALNVPQGGTPTFGVTVVIPSGLRGEIYYVRPGTPKLPDFRKLEPVGTIYTTKLNVPPRYFTEGFPGVTSRIVWFAIDYTGKFWIEKPGTYHFSLLSDDGSRLYIDDRMVIDNDGIHSAETRDGAIDLARGIHKIHLSFFQGPGGGIALVLAVARPGEAWQVFDTNDFAPPRNPENWDSKPEQTHASQWDTALALLSASPPRHDFEFHTSCLNFESGSRTWLGVLVFAASGFADTPAISGETDRMQLSLLALVKSAHGKILEKYEVGTPRGITLGGQSETQPRSLIYTRAIALPSGRYKVDALLSDSTGRQASVSSARIEVPKPRKGLGLSSVILVERTETGDLSTDDPMVFQGRRIVPLLAPEIDAHAKAALYFVIYPDPAQVEKPSVNLKSFADGNFLGEQSLELPPADVSGAIPFLIEPPVRCGRREWRVSVSQGSAFIFGSVHSTAVCSAPSPRIQ